MHQDIIHSYERRVARTRRRSVLRKIVGTLACLVIFCTTYVLILPAITMEQKTFCGLEEHTHTDACYKQTSNRNLICTADQLTVHSHTDACYAEGGTLICGQADYLAHTHNEQCFDTNGELVCTLNERSAHQHTDDCYTPGETQEVVLHVHSEACNGLERGELICEEIERSGHSHNESCYVVTNELSCTIPEGHVHGDGCYTFPLICTEIDETHVHDDICYDSTPILICCIEQENHIHETACYQKDLICTLAEDPGHSHSDECYAWNNVIICGKEEGEAEPTEAPETILICTEPIAVTHVHGDECFEIITSEQENICNNIEEGHVHSDTCYERICGLEEHVHSIACYSDPEADLETEKDWKATFAHVNLTGIWEQDVISIAQTQLGYTESTRNYVVSEDNSIYGYTRYGAWYGDPYGNWCAMFASFCLNYAEVDGMPLHRTVRYWIEDLRNEELYHKVHTYEPIPGDLIFFDITQDGTADHVGLVFEVKAATDSQNVQYNVIEGNSANCVQHVTYDANDPRILGFSELPDNPDFYQCHIERHTHNEYCTDGSGEIFCTKEEHRHSDLCNETVEEIPEILTQTAETDNYIVTVTYSSDLELPEGAELRVVEYARDSEIFRQRCEEAGYELNWLLNIGFYLGEEELDLSGQFDVKVTSKDGYNPIEVITHFADAGMETLDATPVEEGSENAEGSVSFSSSSFSDFGGISTFALLAGHGELYDFTVVGPNDTFVDGMGYMIYSRVGNTDSIVVATGTQSNSTTFTMSTGYWVSLVTGGSTWQAYESTILDANSSNSGYIWTAEAYTNNFGYSGIRLKSPNGDQYLYLNNSSNDNTNAWHSFTNGRYSFYLNNTTQLYAARTSQVNEGERILPAAVSTGSIDVDVLRFYNLVEMATGTVDVLPGCIFEIENTSTHQKYYVESGENMSVMLPINLTAGTYTITEVYVPDGYLGDHEPVRTFTLETVNGRLQFANNNSNTIGIFMNHADNQLAYSKLAEVENYNNRTYQITMNALSMMHTYTMDPVDVLFVVDQSNSMLFPSALNPVQSNGSNVTVTLSTRNAQTNVNNLNNLLKQGKLEKGKMYYIISDPNGTSTVWAVWHDGSAWIYQDASYYAKAWHNNEEGYQQNNELAGYAVNSAFKSNYTENGQNYKANGGGFAYAIGGSLAKHIGANTTQTFTIYTASGTLNRLHYLENAMAAAIYQLSSVNPENRVAIIKFTKEVDKHIIGPYELNDENVSSLINEVRHIKTDGGTRQDLALASANDLINTNYNKGADLTFTLLITDGAPNVDASKIEGVYSATIINANNIKQKSTLMTVALSMGDVERGSAVMKQIATDDPSNTYGKMFYPCEDAALLIQAVNDLLFSNMKQTGILAWVDAHIFDSISDAFYAIAWSNREISDRKLLYSEGGKNWYVLEAYDWITVDGEYVGPDKGTTGVGQLLRGKDHKTTDHCYQTQKLPDGSIGQVKVCQIDTEDINYQYIQWDDQQIGSEFSWEGVFYVKAKEDFIGGNAINTNKDAHISVGIGRVKYEQPNVNVRLLPLNNNNSEVTVYLGDEINGSNTLQLTAPLNTLKDFFDKTYFTKIDPDFPAKENLDYGPIMNAIDPDAVTDDGLERDVFYLKYAMGTPLTSAQWEALVAGESVIVEYSYDDNTQNGPVGYFTYQLTKTGDGTNYESHVPMDVCQPGGDPETDDCDAPVETYTLHVTYTAYRLGDESVLTGEIVRPATNAHNSAGGPGIEVGSVEAGELTDGVGVIYRDNVHEVHVISGEIDVTKKVSERLVSTSDQTFTFNLSMNSSLLGGFSANQAGSEHTFAPATVNTANETQVYTFTITIPAGSSEATVTLTNLPRGAYTVTETITENSGFHVADATIGDATNSYNTKTTEVPALQFVMGNKSGEVAGVNVIGIAEGDVYSSHIEKDFGVYGEAVVTNDIDEFTGEIPVEKVWSDGAEAHDDDVVYLVLYEKIENNLVLVTSGDHAKVIRLDKDTDWKGVFTVALSSASDSVSSHEYVVREVEDIYFTETEICQSGILENDKTTQVWFKTVVSENGMINIGGIAYLVQYSTKTETGGDTPVDVLVVTNHVGRVMPESGGMGTHAFTISGALLIAAALMYVLIQQRKKKSA